MRVISQDGTKDFPYDNAWVSVYEGCINGRVYVRMQICGYDDSVDVADYSTEEKAKKAMEMLRIAYENNEFYHHTANSKYFTEVCQVVYRTTGATALYPFKECGAICSVYGEVVTDYEAMGQCENQMSFADFGIFDKERPLLKTTGCQRTGCVLCGFGCHLEKESRFLRLKETHPKFHNLLYILKNNGVTYAEAIDWVNEHGNMNIKY
jgi:hypothetical protein